MTEHERRILSDFYKDENCFKAAAARVDAGEPLAYVIGEWYFRNQTYKVTPDVLVPQPDTELLVDQLEHWQNQLVVAPLDLVLLVLEQFERPQRLVEVVLPEHWQKELAVVLLVHLQKSVVVALLVHQRKLAVVALLVHQRKLAVVAPLVHQRKLAVAAPLVLVFLGY